MAGIFCAGPCEIWVSAGVGGPGFAAPLVFLGWSEGGVQIDHQPFIEHVFTDLAGPRQPTTRQRLGEIARVSLDLKVLNWAVWQAVSSRASTAVAPGLWPPGTMGEFDDEDFAAFRLCVFRPYALKARNVALGMPPAYNYGGAALSGPDRIGPNGMQALKHGTVFEAIPLINTADYSQQLFNHSYAGKSVAA